jgi:hypothetical protein
MTCSQPPQILDFAFGGDSLSNGSNKSRSELMGVTLDFQLHLDGNGNGLLIGVDSFQVTEGPAYAQQSGQPLSGMTDYNYNGAPQPAIPLSGNQELTNGTLQLKGLSGDTTTQSSWGFYPIDSSRTLAIEIDGQQLGLMFLEAVSK